MQDQETKELTITPDRAIVAVGSRIDAIINECLPVAAQESQNFVQALTLANGIKALRHIFLTDKHIKETVESMQNTHLGFMTDKTDAAIWKSKQGGGKELKPYRYEDIAEVCIEAMLKGYRITNNEFNMIAGRFYAAKNGKFRMINESEGVTDFQFTTTSPAYDKDQGGVQYAKVQGFASWKKDGNLATLGSSDKAEDKLIFKIRVNQFMGEDAIVGKALSKLFSRVLMRIEGKIMPEATDVSNEDIVEAEIVNGSAKDLTDLVNGAKAKQDEVPCPYCQEDIWHSIHAKLMHDKDATRFVCPACNKDGKIEDGKPIGSFPPDHTARNSGDFKESEKLNLKCDFPGCNFETNSVAGLKKHKTQQNHHEKPSVETEPEDAPPETPDSHGSWEEDEKRNNLKTDAYDSLSKELNEMPKDVVMKAKKDIGLNKIIGTLTLEELEALVKRCKELQQSVVEKQRVDMINEIEGNFTPEEIKPALARVERASLSGCSLLELGVAYDFLRKGEGGEDLA